VPFDIAKAWPESSGRRVRGEINGFAFRTSLLPEKGGNRHFLLVNKKMRTGAKVESGARARITLEPDPDGSACAIPVELERALKGARAVRKYFEALPPGMKRYFSNLVAEPKSVEARRRRAERLAEELMMTMEGEEYPPPILRAAFQRQPLAEAGWNAMTPAMRRNRLIGIFRGQSASVREKRTMMVIQEALNVLKRKSPRTDLPM
jgi:uncharacterized protein YdeI (YjbR/CyaY-like superfamily)